MAKSIPGNYDQFVVIAEDNWKFTKESFAQNSVTTKFTVSLAGFEWDCTLTNGQTFKLECNAKVNLELVLLDDKHNILKGFPTRVRFAKDGYGCWLSPWLGWHKCVIMTIRVLKDRSLLPDFTSANVQLGHLKSNCRLWVGGKVFHVNKEMLSMYSPFFDRMFNGDFKEANKDEVKLVTETADPALFRDFLLFMTFQGDDGCQVLPNRKLDSEILYTMFTGKNVAGLLQLAVFYQVDLLKKKCEHFLEKCYEMPISERIQATKKTGMKELQERLLSKFSTVETLRKVFLDYIDNENGEMLIKI